MKSLQASYLPVRTGVALIFAVALAGPAVGQSGQPGDADASATRSATAAAPQPASANSPSAAKEPFQARAIVGPQNTGIQTTFLPVPAGKRLVIENVSAIARRPEGLLMEINFFTYLDTNGNGVGDVEEITFHRIALTEQGTFVDTAISSANHKILVFADLPVGLQARLNGATTGFTQAQVTFSGYLEDLPTVR